MLRHGEDDARIHRLDPKFLPNAIARWRRRDNSWSVVSSCSTNPPISLLVLREHRAAKERFVEPHPSGMDSDVDRLIAELIEHPHLQHGVRPFENLSDVPQMHLVGEAALQSSQRLIGSLAKRRKIADPNPRSEHEEQHPHDCRQHHIRQHSRHERPADPTQLRIDLHRADRAAALVPEKSSRRFRVARFGSPPRRIALPMRREQHSIVLGEALANATDREHRQCPNGADQEHHAHHAEGPRRREHRSDCDMQHRQQAQIPRHARRLGHEQHDPRQIHQQVRERQQPSFNLAAAQFPSRQTESDQPQHVRPAHSQLEQLPTLGQKQRQQRDRNREGIGEGRPFGERQHAAGQHHQAVQAELQSRRHAGPSSTKYGDKSSDSADRQSSPTSSSALRVGNSPRGRADTTTTRELLEIRCIVSSITG